MKRASFLTTSALRAGTCPDRAEQAEHDQQLAALRGPCAALGLELFPVAWDDASFDPAAVDGVVIGTAWDYAARPEAFLRRLEGFAAKRPLVNPIGVVRWNLEKTYLRDLESKGARVVPTLWCDAADETSVLAAFDELGADRIVVKPTIGQTSWRQCVLSRGEALPPADELPPKAAMIQPFQAAILAEGELSFVFIDGAFSHCVQKQPAAGDYRIQSNFGGRDRAHSPSQDDLACAETVIAALQNAVDERPLYARVDMVRAADGGLALMELEVIEPYLFPYAAPELGRRYAEALVRRLG